MGNIKSNKENNIIISFGVLDNIGKNIDNNEEINEIEKGKDINNNRTCNDLNNNNFNNNKEIIISKGCEDLSDICENNNLSDNIVKTKNAFNNNIPLDTHSSKESNEENNESYVFITTPSSHKK